MDEAHTASRPSRRRVLKLGAGAGLAAALGGAYALGVEPTWWRVEARDLDVHGLPAELDGASLVQLSDLHVGRRVDGDYLVRVLREVGDWAPDLVVVTGDTVDYRGGDELERARRVLRALPQGRLGTFAILGNHDYGRGWREADVAAGVARALREAGARVLRSEVAVAGGLQIAGMDDLWAGALDVNGTLAKLDPARAALVLCHNPDGVDLPGWDGYRGWILAGHTHGGQVKPPFLPPPLLPVKNRRYTRGAFELAGGRRLYVNPGLGWLRRVRCGVRPEVTVFRLRPAPRA